MIEIKAPDRTLLKGEKSFPMYYPWIFLAGSIEMGKAIPWQDEIVKALSDKGGIVLNPRRDDWDSSWVQEISNPNFYEQVDWEIKSLELADIVVFVFDPNTMSPITLMELGLMCNLDKLIHVFCPPGFWRKGNVDYMIQRFSLNAHASMESLIEGVRSDIDKMNWYHD